MEKNLSEITRKEWIIFRWEEITSMGDSERRFLTVGENTPDEVIEAGEAWDFLQSVKEETEIKIK